MFSEEKVKKLVSKYPTRTDIEVDILVGPSSVGKTWVIEKVVDTHRFIISTTTRSKRPHEEAGKEYEFVSKERFEEYLEKGKMVLSFILNNEYYGYRGENVDNAIAQQKKPIAIIYYKVLDAFLEKFPNSRIFFMFPPDNQKGLNLLDSRTIKRDGKDSRHKDTTKQMQKMYSNSPSLLEKYSNSKMYVIKDNQSAYKVINDLNS